jgi:hypothetical protein
MIFQVCKSYLFDSWDGSVSIETGNGLDERGSIPGRSKRSSAEVKNGEAVPSLHHSSSWRGASLIKHGDRFTLTCSFTLWLVRKCSF